MSLRISRIWVPQSRPAIRLPGARGPGFFIRLTQGDAFHNRMLKLGGFDKRGILSEERAVHLGNPNEGARQTLPEHS